MIALPGNDMPSPEDDDNQKNLSGNEFDLPNFQNLKKHLPKSGKIVSKAMIFPKLGIAAHQDPNGKIRFLYLDDEEDDKVKPTVYDCPWEVLNTEVCMGCGHGNVRENVNYVYGGLKLIERESALDQTDQEATDQLDRDEAVHFGSVPAMRFFFHWANACRLADHEENLPGELSDAGRQFIAFYDRFCGPRTDEGV